MIRSMTAYACAETAGSMGVLRCELRAVNHRYLDLSFRLPEELRHAEGLMRELITAKLSRGKIDISVRLQGGTPHSDSLQIDTALLGRLKELADQQCIPCFPNMRVEFTELLRFPGVLQQAEPDQPALQHTLRMALEQALHELIAAREREGDQLAVLLAGRLDSLDYLLGQIRGWLPDIRAGLSARLHARLADIKQPADPGRLEQELILQLTRIDVDEELDRLGTHITEVRRVLKRSEPVGRRLDFLMQELNREANTLGAKSIDARSTNVVVEMKVLIEQMREQIQNIE